MDQPPNYVAIMNGTSLPLNTDSTVNANVNVSSNADANANPASLNNDQVVRQEANAPPLENNKTTDAEPASPYPQNG